MRRPLPKFWCAAVAFAFALNCTSAEPVGGDAFANWPGLQVHSKEAGLAIPGEAVWRHPDGARGAYHIGFRSYHDGAADWHELYGVQFEAWSESATQAVEITILLVGTGTDDPPVTARTVLAGNGWQTIALPWSAFDAPGARRDYLLAIKELRIKAGGGGGVLKPRNVRTVKAPALSAETEVRGKAVPAGGTVEYLASIGNVTATPRCITAPTGITTGPILYP